jgi:hypothetical protein
VFRFVVLLHLPNQMKAIEWDEVFDASYGIINLHPEQYVFYRGHDVNFPLTNRPAYFGTKEVAQQYAKKPCHIVSAFTNTRKLRLIDVRFMKNILRDIFENNANQFALNDDMKSVTLSFGLCSLNHQIQMASQRFNDSLSEFLDPNRTLSFKNALESLQSSYTNSIYEQPGVRIAETTNDSYTMGFLKGLFEHAIDGFISPQTKSPFHIERTNNTLMSELIIFNPISCGFRKFDSLPHITVYEDMYDIYQQHKLQILRNNNAGIIKYKMFVQSGGTNDNYLPSVEILHLQYDSNKELRHNYEKGLQSGLDLSKNASFYELESIKPCVPVNPWPKTMPYHRLPVFFDNGADDLEILSQTLSFLRRKKTRKLKHTYIKCT